MTKKFGVAYFDDALFDLPTLIADAQNRLKRLKFDTLVGTGFSGGVVVPALALAMGKQFVLVRKESDNSHHGPGKLIGELGERWIFVDDFISSGSTREYVLSKIRYYAPDSRCVGQYLYVKPWDDADKFTRYDVAWEPQPEPVKRDPEPVVVIEASNYFRAKGPTFPTLYLSEPEFPKFPKFTLGSVS